MMAIKTGYALSAIIPIGIGTFTQVPWVGWRWYLIGFPSILLFGVFIANACTALSPLMCISGWPLIGVVPLYRSYVDVGVINKVLCGGAN